MTKSIIVAALVLGMCGCAKPVSHKTTKAEYVESHHCVRDPYRVGGSKMFEPFDGVKDSPGWDVWHCEDDVVVVIWTDDPQPKGTK